MKIGVTALAAACLLMPTQRAVAELEIRLFRTGDATKSSFFTVTPGEVFTVDAEITSTGTDDLNTYFAQFTSTPVVGGAAVTFTDQSGVVYRNSANNYVFGDATEISTLGIPPTPDGVTILDPFNATFDASLVAGNTSITAAPLLLARMQFMADAAATPGDSVELALDLVGSSFSDDLGGILNIGTATAATVQIAAVPEPSGMVLAALLLGAFGVVQLRRKKRLVRIAGVSGSTMA
ncbi:MAG: hypothetical protein R3C19_12390 [Planctomycetaceae bacterium]